MPPLWCLLIGDENLFSVDINQSSTVEQLKKKIKTENQHDLNIDPRKLTLYRAEVDDSIDKYKTTLITELNRLSENLSECRELDERHELSEIYGEVPPEKRYYTLVKRPKGESIYIRACGGACLFVVRLLAPRPTTPPNQGLRPLLAPSQSPTFHFDMSQVRQSLPALASTSAIAGPHPNCESIDPRPVAMSLTLYRQPIANSLRGGTILYLRAGPWR